MYSTLASLTTHYAVHSGSITAQLHTVHSTLAFLTIHSTVHSGSIHSTLPFLTIHSHSPLGVTDGQYTPHWHPFPCIPESTRITNGSALHCRLLGSLVVQHQLAALIVHCAWVPHALHPSHCPLYIVHCPLCIVHCPLCIVHCPLCMVHCPLCIVHCPLCIVHCPQSTVYHALSIVS